jgi:hypothetical protein
MITYSTLIIFVLKKPNNYENKNKWPALIQVNVVCVYGLGFKWHNGIYLQVHKAHLHLGKCKCRTHDFYTM